MINMIILSFFVYTPTKEAGWANSSCCPNWVSNLIEIRFI